MEVLEKVSKAISSDYGIKVTFSGTKAFTDGKHINLPFVPPELQTEENIDKLRGYCDHEIAHVLFSDMKMLEADWFIKSPQAVMAMTQILEDIRVELKMSKKYAGSRVNLERLCLQMEDKVSRDNLLGSLLLDGRRNIIGYSLKSEDQSEIIKSQLGEDVFQKIANLGSSMESYELAKELLNINEEHQEEQSGEGEGDSEDSDGKSDKKDKKESKSSKSKSKPKSEDKDKDKKKKKDKEKNDGEDEEGKSGEESHGEDSREDENSGASEDDGKSSESEGSDGAGMSAGKSGSEDGDGSGDDSTSAGSDGEGEGSMDAVEESGGAERGEGNRMSESAGGGGKSILPVTTEFDDYIQKSSEEIEKASGEYLNSGQNYMSYSCDEDEFKPIRPASSQDEFNKMRARLGNIGSLKAKVASMFNSRVAGHWENGKECGRVNSRALAGIVSGRRDLFKERWVCNDADTAITFLLDFSGSMSCSRKIETAIETAILFSEILNGTKVKFEILGFTTGEQISTYKKAARQADESYRRGNHKAYDSLHRYGRIERLVTYQIKLFNEAYGKTVKDRFSNWREVNMRNNCDGESVMLAFNRLMQRRERRKIMFVLSDGQPASYGSDKMQHKHLKDVVHNIETISPVEIVGIGLMTDSVKSYYSNNIIIRDPKKLPETILENLKRVLKVK